LIVGLLRPDSGWAEVAGFRTSESPDEVKSRVGLVSANDGVYPWLSVQEMLLFFADLYGLGPREASENLRTLAELFQLTPLLDRRCALLSTGQRQRVTLARALIHSPPVVLLDEPTRGLDVLGSQVVVDYVRRLRD
jgi:ABC-2 type transport system ATP-binding protein/sodium transport system ATP-binding protein